MKNQKISTFIAGKLFLIAPVLIFSFSVFKAWHMSLTIDESASYLFYVHDTYIHIIECTRLEANNHILNSILMKFFSSWLPLSEITLRLPNLLGHAIFLCATWMLIKDFKNAWFRLGIYLFINLNPYLLDFFCLARGYALSWALMTLSLYFLKLFVENPGRKFIYIAFCFLVAALAVVASFPVLGYYLALFIIYIIYDFLNIKTILNDSIQIRFFFFRVIFVIFLSAVLLSYVLHLSFMLMRAHLLYFGGDSGFWNDTVTSLIISWLYNAPYASIGKLVLQSFVIIIASGAITAMIFPFFTPKYRNQHRPFFYMLIAIFLLVVFSTIAQHYVFDTKYLILRTAGYILVLFLLVSGYLFDYIVASRFRLVSVFLIAGISLFHFGETFNTHSVYEWQFDSETKKMMQDLGAVHHKSNNVSDHLVIFHSFWLNAATCLFYQELYKYNWMMPVEYGKTVTHSEDYYYLPDDTLNLLNGYKDKIIRHYPEVQESLVENLDKVKRINYGDKTLNLFDTVSVNSELQKNLPRTICQNVKCIRLDTGSFSPFIHLDAMAFRHRPDIVVMASAKVFFPSKKSGGLVIALYDKTGKILRWDSFDFGNYYLQDTGWMNIPFKLKIDKMYPDAESARIFIWNTGKNHILASELKAVITEF